MAVEILHRVFSHDGEGGWDRVPLDEREAEGVVAPEVLGELDSIMGKMVPAGDEPAWMVRRFAAGNDTYACLVVSYPKLVLDDGERYGLLTHARLVRVPAGEAWLDVAALVAAAQQAPLIRMRAAGPRDRLPHYLDFIAGEEILFRDVTAAELELQRTFLCDAVAGWMAVIGQRHQIRIALPASEGPLMPNLARAWAAIPVAMQRSIAWAVGVDEGCPVDVIFAVGEGKKASAVAKDSLVQFVASYVNFLLDDSHDFTTALRDPEMTTAVKLNAALQRAEPLSAIRELAPSTPVVAPAKEKAMKKEKKDNPSPPASGGELDPALVAELERQFQAISASLRHYVDQRIATIEVPAPTISAPPPIPAAPLLGRPDPEPPPPSPPEPKPRRPLFSTQPETKGRVWTLKRVLAVIALLVFITFVGFAIGVVRYVIKQVPVDTSGIVSGLKTKVKKATQQPIPTQLPNPEVAKLKETRKAAIQAAITKAGRDTWAEELKALLLSDSAIFSNVVSAVVKHENLLEDDSIRLELEDTASQRLDGPAGSAEQMKGSDARARLRAYLIDHIGGTAFDGKLDDVELPKIERFVKTKARAKDFKTRRERSERDHSALAPGAVFVTLFRIEQAVVMDTDDIPGRGGYAVVGMSRGVEEAERVFVSQNFGISDYLHDPQNQRIFYSFFTVPGGRRALVRRFARGYRRNRTQNRLFVHTLFIGEELFDALDGLPWLLIQDVVQDDLSGIVVDAPLPPIEANIDETIVAGISQRLAKRREVVDRQLGTYAVAEVLTKLGSRNRVPLPQGAAYEQLTMLAWSLLPRPDREALAWTQHDPQNIAGVTFNIANVAEGGESLRNQSDPLVRRLVDMNIESDRDRLAFDERAVDYRLSIRDVERIQSWLAWRDALAHLTENIRATDAEVLEYLKKLEKTARRRFDEPWINGVDVLQMLWDNIPAAIQRGEKPPRAVERWAGLLRQSGLHGVIFHHPPDARWLVRAKEDVGADLLVWFFLWATENEPLAAPVRDEIARWVLRQNGEGVEAKTRAQLAVRLAVDGSRLGSDVLALLLTSDAGLTALRDVTPDTAEYALFTFNATRVAMQRRLAATPSFIVDVLVPALDVSPGLAARITPEIAKEMAAQLRAKPGGYVRLAAHFQPEVVAEVEQTIVEWLMSDPKGTAALASAILPGVLARKGSAGAAPLAFAIARAGEPAAVWFGVLLERAAAIDTRNDARATQSFESEIERLPRKSLNLDGALDPLLRLLDVAQLRNLRIGDALRSLVLLLRPVWKEDSARFVGLIGALLRQTRMVKGWAPIVEAIVADRLRGPVAELVVEYWTTIDPSEVPALGPNPMRMIATLDAESRQRLAAVWQTRMGQLPESEATTALIGTLFPEGGRDVRILLRLREIERGDATHQTLNGLDKDLYESPDHRYPEAMREAIIRHVRQHDAVDRITGYLKLLEARDVSQTVKTIIELHVLEKSLRELKPARWDHLVPESRRACVRAVPAMSIGYQIGLDGSPNAQSAFENVCRANQRHDVLRALVKGKRRHTKFQWLKRLFRLEPQLVAQR